MQNIQNNARNTVILGIDSSAKSGAAAVMRGGEILSTQINSSGLTHSQTLMPMIDSVISNSGIKTEDIGIIAVTVGPGSFTGLRIGLSSAKGIAAVTGAECVGLSTLEALAFGAKSDGIICAVMDARVKRVYNALFLREGEKFTRLTEDRTLEISALSDELKTYGQRIYLVGDAASTCFEQYKDSIENISVDTDNINIKGENVCALASTKSHSAVNYKQLNPHYIQLPQAQRELIAKTGGISK